MGLELALAARLLLHSDSRVAVRLSGSFAVNRINVHAIKGLRCRWSMKEENWLTLGPSQWLGARVAPQLCFWVRHHTLEEPRLTSSP